MTTLNLVDREQRHLMDGMLSFDPKLHSIADFRSLMEGLGSLLTPEPVDYELRQAPRLDGEGTIRVLFHRPQSGDALKPAILYLHGGGMVAGSPELMAGSHLKLASDLDAVVAAPGYRLAPEFPFPSGLEDCYSVLKWLHANAAELKIDPNRIAVMGDSGGGGLAAALALLARDRKEIPLCAQILLYPMLDMRTGTEEAPFDDPLTGEFVVNRPLTAFSWNAVKGSLNRDSDQVGYLSPALAEDLHGLPPAIVVTGALDLFREEDVSYAQRLLRSGVPTDLFVYARAVHGFDMLASALATQARTNLIASIIQVLKSQAPAY
ncbi:alpha/beta hydrolase [Rhizobium sp. 16-449-1b]|uniref:alpha/beta hydrolase n=1 Tax=Rhizobium sp. 16-449-1b TaxID=2819989 RepID=UPI001ADC8C90|nr:alpha/beta hydrolase [Rhizobium sp. 16-449-1b]